MNKDNQAKANDEEASPSTIGQLLVKAIDDGLTVGQFKLFKLCLSLNLSTDIPRYRIDDSINPSDISLTERLAYDLIKESDKPSSIDDIPVRDLYVGTNVYAFGAADKEDYSNTNDYRKDIKGGLKGLRFVNFTDSDNSHLDCIFNSIQLSDLVANYTASQLIDLAIDDGFATDYQNWIGGMSDDATITTIESHIEQRIRSSSPECNA